MTPACCFLLSFACAFVAPAAAEEATPIQQAVLDSIETQRERMIGMSDAIWRFAEPALQEDQSARLLADHAEQQGFAVERGVAGLPTAFTATYGSGRPVIGIMGEYDALPGLSQQADAVKAPLADGAAGHGCGHNLFGVASLAAAIAIKERIAAGDFAGTIRFYGTPAEEAHGGKLYMIRAGLFEDVDVALAWHPASETVSDTSGSQALADVTVEFKGRAAHAAYDPWNGRSAADALELFLHGINLLREHVQPTVRMHYTITHAGDVPNVVPESASCWLWLRDSKHADVDRLLVRVRDIVKGAALAAGVEGTLTVRSGDYEMLVNWEGQRLVQKTFDLLGAPRFSAQDHEFARALQRACGVEPTGLSEEVAPLEENPGAPEGGSSDVADVSWNVPVLHLFVATAPKDSPWHAWPVVASSGMSIGHTGMVHAAKVLGVTMTDLFQDAEARDRIRREFEASTAGTTYEGYLADGPPPLDRLLPGIVAPRDDSRK